MKTVAQKIAEQFNEDGNKFYIETDDDQKLYLPDICKDLCVDYEISGSDMDKVILYTFDDGSRMYTTESWWTNVDEEINNCLKWAAERRQEEE